MTGLFSNNSAATLIQGSYPALQDTEAAEQQAFTQNAQLDTEQAGLTEQTASMNAENAAIEGADVMGQQAQAYNNSGVLQQGSPRIVEAQTQRLAQAQVTNIIAQGQLSSQASLMQATQTMNLGYASLLNQNNQYQTQLAQAKIGASMNMYSGFGSDISQMINLFMGGPGNSMQGGQGGGTGAGGSTGTGVP